MIIVSDTSPLNYLILIDAIDVLPHLFGQISVPIGVMEELDHPRTPVAVKNWLNTPPAWLLIHTPSTRLSEEELWDPGESQAIALAHELHASAVLIDEKRGRRIAKEHGFITIGTITILELAAQQNLIDLPSAFDRLQQTSFQVTQPLISAALSRNAALKREQS